MNGLVSLVARVRTSRRVRRLSAVAGWTLLALPVWSGLAIVATLQGWGRQPLSGPAPQAFMHAAVKRTLAGHEGNVAFVLLEDGQVFGQHFASKGKPVDRDTLFQAASLSKWVTAWGVMTLVESGSLDLDAPVEKYFKRWRLPPSNHDNSAVTVRRLLSHTAGLTDGLGYLGFPPGKPVQPLVASLNRAADAAPGADGFVRVGVEPGSSWRYSGGGYTLLQLVIEDVTGEPFAAYMQRAVLDPLGMRRSTYRPPEPDQLATFYDEDGSEAPHHRYTAAGAASLYTSAADLTRFIQAHLPGPGGELPGRSVLSPRTLELMRKPHAILFGQDHWGLGVILYVPNGKGGFVIGHDGGNAPAINTAARLDPASGDGIIALETGDPSLASRLAGEWTYWRTGEVGMVGVSWMLVLQRIAIGSTVILLVAGFVAWRVWRPVGLRAA